ncbi:hypothetical protein [Acrocarpospora macrocephala]|uniref:hypothetical protein n=1 Tax=Acrocarpospora macrocephala TaxID=150177 RepID=UPI0012D36C24|nr:hypothetical protein [Acrocarpospora macrocephala]
MNWAEYEPYEPLYEGTMHDMPRRQAREEFNHLMSAKGERGEQLRLLLLANGIELDTTDEAVQVLHDWFRVNVESEPSNPERLRPIWYAVVNDISLFLGDVMISRCPNLEWVFWTGGKRDSSYQRHVITGFRAVANPKYYVDVDLNLATQGLWYMENVDQEPNQFVAMLREAAEMGGC